MSRIGKLPILLPTDVDFKYQDSVISVQGKFGLLSKQLPNCIKIKRSDNLINVIIKNETKSFKSLHGLYRTLINNMIIGVSEQFESTLILKGVGYKATIQNNKIILNLGYSHPIVIKIPEAISIQIVQNTTINLKSCDKQFLGLFAAKIRSWRPPEPYKGKGILYQNEQIIRKAGKSGKK